MVTREVTCQECERLKAEKESWGNEFTAVHMAKERIAKLEEALKYIIEHEWAIEKPKWAAEFVDVARKALESK